MNTTVLPHYRHGDVLLQQVESIPGCGINRPGPVLVAGTHNHCLTGEFEITEVNDRIYFTVGEHGAAIVHEEHETIPLPPGQYVVVNQVEDTPWGRQTVVD